MLLMASVAFSCSDDKDKNDPTPPPSDPQLSVDQTELPFERDKATVKLAITSNVKWTATSSVSWCELSKKTGTGNDTIQVSVTENPATKRRDGEIIVTAGGTLKIRIPVVQLGEDIEILYFVNGQEFTKKVVIDFETAVYQFRIKSNIAIDHTWENDNWLQYRFRGGDTKDWNFQFRPSDNIGDGREALVIMNEIEGPFLDTLIIAQKPFSDFLRFFSDTIYAGSHFSLVEVLGRTTIPWDYEIIEQPSWVTAVEKENPFQPQLLGKRSKLIIDLQTNTASTSREFQVKFKYNVSGKPQEELIHIIQMANNPLGSDSLVLIKLLEKNAEPGVGLEVENWFDEIPVTQWGGPTFKDVDGVKRMVALSLSGSYLCYELTSDIANLSELKELKFEKNYLRGSLPKEIGRMKKLEVLSVNENFETGIDNPTYQPSGISGLPKEIGVGCTQLRELGLALNAFESIPEAIYEMKNLEVLNMGMNTKLRSIDNERLKTCTKLKDINFGYLPYTGPFLDFFYECPDLEIVSFNQTHFADGASLKDEFDRLPRLKNLEMDSCNLSGAIPVSLTTCSQMTWIGFESNNLSGSVLTEFGNMMRLATLKLNNNELTGTVPASLVTVGNVGKRVEGATSNVFLHGNKLSGEIPAAIKTLDVWTSQMKYVPVEYDSEMHYIGRWEPEIYICPQQTGFGFTNCSEKK